jgi:hypothetical protein
MTWMVRVLCRGEAVWRWPDEDFAPYLLTPADTPPCGMSVDGWSHQSDLPGNIPREEVTATTI